MKPFSISLVDWSGRAPQLDSKDAFSRWVHQPYPIEPDGSYKPACTNVPARLRGKSSTLSRLVMAPFFELIEAHSLDASAIDFVFASRFGEIQILESLFHSIYSNEPLSPVDFCNSVHHTATGYLSIAAKNMRISRTVSAGPHTFAAGLLESWQLLANNISDTVALLVADETVPPFFVPGEKERHSYGMVLLFTKALLAKGDSILLPDILDAQHNALSATDWLRNRKAEVENS
ncbi:MAG: beta-ketoacyl synthase chain length factor [Deltaproteobacteria bacterium]|nr:beta-ketoacyl synthase chain length factor [Deltaproteobacteria bacterium]